MATTELVAKVLAVLAEVYGIELSRSLIKAYQMVLRDIDDEILERASAAWMAKSKWFPKPAELREESISQIAPQYLPAEDAWMMVLHHAERYGYSRKPEFDDERITNAALLTGWRDICYTEYSQLHYIRSRFERIYESLVTRAKEEMRSLPNGDRNGDGNIKQLTEKIRRSANEAV